MHGRFYLRLILFTRLHNDANVLALGEKVIGVGYALKIVNTFLNTEFEGGRHQRRVDKIGININYEREFTLSGIDFEYADGQSIFADLNGTKIAVCSGENIPYTECDLLISKTANYDCMSFYTAYFNLSDYKKAS